MMADSRGSYERRAPSLPRRYKAIDGRWGPRIELGAPVADALGVDPGDDVCVHRNDRGEIVLVAVDGDGGDSR